MPTRIAQFTPEEIEDHRRSKEAGERLRHAGKLPAGSGCLRQRVADLCGVSRRQVDKIAEIYAERDRRPDLMRSIVEDMNRTGKVDGAHRRMRRVLDELRVLSLAPIAGRFLTLVLDPPWEDDSVSESQLPPYATMSLDALRAIPVPGWQRDEGHIYVHCPGPWLEAAIALIKGWGYAYKTPLVWQKSRWSRGRYVRNEDEFVVFGTRGGLMTRRQDRSNHFTGPVGEHSDKPESFYQLVRELSPPPYGEAFGRRDRPDFTPLYQAAPLREAAE